MAEKVAKANKTTVALYFNNNEFSPRWVASFAMSFDQPTDISGQLSGIPRGGRITMRLKALSENKGIGDLYLWMIEKDSYKSGYIEFKKPSDIGELMKRIYFKNAKCVSYLEYWQDETTMTKEEKSDFNLSHWEEITITCQEIYHSVVGKSFINNWDLEDNT